MPFHSQETTARAHTYCIQKLIGVEGVLGWGQDGVVLATKSRTAVKAFRYVEQYCRERDAYLRLKDENLLFASGFTIPRLIAFDDQLWIVEIEIVKPPYALDFASATLDRPLDFSSELEQEIEEGRMELFGDDWPQVTSLLSKLRGIGIFLSDVNPRNISVR